MSDPLTDGKVLVLGGATGIGAGVAAALGERAVVWSRRTGVDATDPEAVGAALRAHVAEHGVPWGLVHTVGDFDERPLLASDREFYDWMLDSNLRTAFVAMRVIVPELVAARRGRAVFFSAAGAGERTAKLRAPVYFAAKAALVSLVRSLAKEIASSGVTANVISPGIIRHPTSHAASQDRMQGKVPSGRGGTVEDVVPLVLGLLGGEMGYVTGQEIAVDGGLSL